MRWWLFLGIAQLSACVSSSSFGCSEDAQCSDGSCEPNGYCSFPDDTCPSGRRYGEFAGEGLSGVCVQGTGDASTGGPSETSTSGDPTTAATAGSSDADGTTGPTPLCLGTCASDPVLPWSGPVVLAPEDSDACDRASTLWTAGDGLVPAGPCDCACDEGEAMASCGYDAYLSAECDGDPADFLSVPTGECVPVELVLGVVAVSETGEPSYCEGSPPLPAAFEQLLAVCEPTATGTCEDGSACLEPPEGTSVCYWRDGEHDCPSADEQRTVLHRNPAGLYECGCNCGAAGSTCETIDLFQAEDCAASLVSLVTVPSPACTPLEFEKPVSSVYAQVRPTGCEDNGSRNTPEPDPQDPPALTDPVTLCCR